METGRQNFEKDKFKCLHQGSPVFLSREISWFPKILPRFFLSFHQYILVIKTYLFFLNVTSTYRKGIVYRNTNFFLQINFPKVKPPHIATRKAMYISIDLISLIWNSFLILAETPVFPWFPWLEKVFKISPDFCDQWETCYMHFNQPKLMINNNHLDQNLFVCLSMTLFIISTSHKRSLGQGNVFTGVCLSTGEGFCI